MDLLEAMPETFRVRYAEAVETESLARDVAFLPVPEFIGSFPVRPLTLTHYLTLRAIRSPLLSGALPSQTELAAFLWLLNPAYHPVRGKTKFLKSCRCFCVPPRPLLPWKWAHRRWIKRKAAALLKASEIIGKARIFVREAFADAPPTRPGLHASYYCDGCNVLGALGREYGWSCVDVLDMPMRRIFQMLKEIKDQHVPGAKFFNASDRVLQEFVEEFNKRGAN